MVHKKKLLLLLTEDWFFYSHFLERAIAAKKNGYKVIVCAKKNKHKSLIESKGLIFKEIPFDRRSLNPVKEFRTIFCIFRIYAEEKPNIVHQVSLKPIFYGTLIATILGIKSIINAPIGMGYIYSSNEFKALLLKPFIKYIYRIFLSPKRGIGKNIKVVFENNDDLNELVLNKALNYEQAIIIRGAGVDLGKYKKYKELKKTNKIPVVSLVGRMLKDKGVYEFVAAANIIHSEGIKAKFLLVGDCDVLNPSSIPKKTLRDWNDNSPIEWVGWVEDVPSVLSKTDILCLPSYREGLPKALLEGGAMAIPLVTTDTVGCRDVVKEGKNGFLVPVRSVQPLVFAIKKLLMDEKLRIKMGKESYELIEKKFSSKIVIKKTLNLYKKM